MWKISGNMLNELCWTEGKKYTSNMEVDRRSSNSWQEVQNLVGEISGSHSGKYEGYLSPGTLRRVLW
jgi:hypothetical protein